MLFLWTKYEYTVEVFTLPQCKPDPPENCWAPETNSGIQWPFRGASPCPEHTDPTRGPKGRGQCAWPCSLSCWEPSGTPTIVLVCCMSREQKPRSCSTHAVLARGVGTPTAQWLQTTEDDDISAQHWAATDDAYPNMLDWGHNGLD